MSSLRVENTKEGIIFAVKVVPGSSKTSLAEILDGMLKIKIAAPAEKGKANSALIDFLSDIIGVKKNSITITSGQTNPVKTINIEGVTVEQLLNKFGVS